MNKGLVGSRLSVYRHAGFCCIRPQQLICVFENLSLS